MEKGMSTEIAHHDREDRRHVDTAVRPGDGAVQRPFDRWGSPRSQLADELVSERLKTRGARPPNLESENEGATERDLTAQHGGTVAATGPTTGFEGTSAMPLSRPLRADPVERGAANVPTLVTKKAGNDVEGRGLARAEQQPGTPLVPSALR
jgi:hypothetical protein